MNPFLALQLNLADVNFSLVMPEVIVCLAAVAVMMVDAFARPTQRWVTGSISLCGINSRRRQCSLLWVSGRERR